MAVLAVPACLTRGQLVARHGPKLYSQFDEELVIRDYFQDKREGFFVDVGASDYRLDSTTYYLEERLGWRGIAVDAIPAYADGYRKNRPGTKFFSFFVSDTSDRLADFYLIEQNKRMSSSSEEWARTGGAYEKIKVPTITLDKLLEREGVVRIDLLSMDVENAEPAALAGFDIDKYRPALVCIELHGQVKARIEAYFAQHGYGRLNKYARVDRVNGYFVPRVGRQDGRSQVAKIRQSP